MEKRFAFLFPAIIIIASVVSSVKGNVKICFAGEDSINWETLIDGNSFKNYVSFEKDWNYLYPWGEDHNGSARMVAGPKVHSNLFLQEGKILHIKADYVKGNLGLSKEPPHLNIKYLSAAIYAKHQVEITDVYPEYEVSGDFKAPTAKGTWPAFWLTSVKGWPPESDILEYKGDSLNWQNTFITPTQATTIKTKITTAQTDWHEYKAVLKKVNSTDIDIAYYIDGKFTGTHRCNFMNNPMWIIINLQMEGSSGKPGPEVTTDYYIKNVVVKRGRKI